MTATAVGKFIFPAHCSVIKDVCLQHCRMVEFETFEDLKRAISSLDGTDFKGAHVTCVADVLPHNLSFAYNVEY